MLLDIVHETRYRYAPPVHTSRHMAHLTPAQSARQQLLSHELAIAPLPAHRSESLDVWGNTRTFFSFAGEHDELAVVARSRVMTAPAPACTSGIGWEDARERMRYHRHASYDPASEFVFASPHVPRAGPFAEYAAPSFVPGRTLVDAAHELMARIHADFEYEPQATDVGTPVLDALRLRKGVCQDFAHVMLACLRSIGLPARYVSGYLLNEPAPGQPQPVGGDASHAWVAVYVPRADGGGDWMGLDPTNCRSPGEEYVVLATGRDYSDVSPLRGVIHGGADHELHVAVTVTPAPAPTIAG